jgi:predicted protein tyrosine phosphatase
MRWAVGAERPVRPLIRQASPATFSRKGRRTGDLKRARVVCLDIPDDYTFMQPERVALLETRVGAHLK